MKRLFLVAVLAVGPIAAFTGCGSGSEAVTAKPSGVPITQEEIDYNAEYAKKQAEDAKKYSN